MYRGQTQLQCTGWLNALDLGFIAENAEVWSWVLFREKQRKASCIFVEMKDYPSVPAKPCRYHTLSFVLIWHNCSFNCCNYQAYSSMLHQISEIRAFKNVVLVLAWHSFKSSYCLPLHVRRIGWYMTAILESRKDLWISNYATKPKDFPSSSSWLLIHCVVV